MIVSGNTFPSGMMSVSMTNCSGGAIFPEIEISLRMSGSINIAAKETSEAG